MSQFVDIGAEERRSKIEAIRSGKCAFKHKQGVFIQHQTHFLLIFCFNPVGLLVTILEHIIISQSFIL